MYMYLRKAVNHLAMAGGSQINGTNVTVPRTSWEAEVTPKVPPNHTLQQHITGTSDHS